MASNRSLYWTADYKKRIGKVEAGHVQTIEFGGKITAAGTADLQGCTAITIVSPTAAIVAHVLPRSTEDISYQTAGDDNMARMMDWVISEYRKHEAQHFMGARSVAMFAQDNDGIVLKEQEEIVREKLKEINLDPSDGSQYQLRLYSVPNNVLKVGYGTLVIDTLNCEGDFPTVYVEDEPVQFDEEQVKPEVINIGGLLYTFHFIDGEWYNWGRTGWLTVAEVEAIYRTAE